MKLTAVFNNTDITLALPSDTLLRLFKLIMDCLARGESYHYALFVTRNGIDGAIYGSDAVDETEAHRDAMVELISAVLESEAD